MIRGKPVRVLPGYKWGKADALGIGDDDDTYLVTTGLGEANDEVARYAAKAINCHEPLVEALHAIVHAVELSGDGNDELCESIIAVIDKALATVEAADKEGA